MQKIIYSYKKRQGFRVEKKLCLKLVSAMFITLKFYVYL